MIIAIVTSKLSVKKFFLENYMYIISVINIYTDIVTYTMTHIMVVTALSALFIGFDIIEGKSF